MKPEIYPRAMAQQNHKHENNPKKGKGFTGDWTYIRAEDLQLAENNSPTGSGWPRYPVTSK